MSTNGRNGPLAALEGVRVVHGRGEAAVAALDGVDFEIDSGDRVAVLGRSGSGKTTLLHVLGGLIRPTAGKVLWQGRPLSSLDEAARTGALAKGISFVFQSANLLPHFTAVENVAFAIHAAHGRADSPLHPDALLALVGLSSKTENLPSELSGGEAQRVALARALAQQPLLLLCDEPTGHLDSDTGERVLDLIDALREETGFALLIATHDSDVAARFDRTLELHDGRIVQEQRHEVLA